MFILNKNGFYMKVRLILPIHIVDVINNLLQSQIVIIHFSHYIWLWFDGVSHAAIFNHNIMGWSRRFFTMRRILRISSRRLIGGYIWNALPLTHSRTHTHTHTHAHAHTHTLRVSGYEIEVYHMTILLSKSVFYKIILISGVTTLLQRLASLGAVWFCAELASSMDL